MIDGPNIRYVRVEPPLAQCTSTVNTAVTQFTILLSSGVHVQSGLRDSGTLIYYKKWKYTPAVRSKILSKLIFASCVWHSDRAYYGLCVLIKDIGRRLPLQLQCSYQGQQGD